MIDEWNVQHGDGSGARAELMSWRTHAHPEAGRRPQALINRKFADRADIVLAIFWRRLILRAEALYATYDDVVEFRAAVTKDPALVLREVIGAARKKR